MAGNDSLTRRHLFGLAGAAMALPAVAGCGSSLRSGSNASGSGDSRTIKVGLVIPQSGVYAALGTDMKRGWDLWLSRNGGAFGDRKVETVVTDEGESPQTGVPAVQKVMQSDDVDVVVGIVNSAVALGVMSTLQETKKLLVVANAGAGDVTGTKRTPYVWRTSFTNAQVSSAVGRYAAGTDLKAGMYALAPAYAAGAEALEGFVTAFEAGGGKVVGHVEPPFGKTSDYQPFLSQVKASGARGSYAFFSGAEAIAFVKQYQQFGLASTVPLVGSGFLAEGSVLEQQGDAALGIKSVLHYSDQLDNPANKAFIADYTAAYGVGPSVFSVQTYDAANVLGRALPAAKGLDGDSLAEALAGIGTVDDSPRGPWSFDGQNPKQSMYLREVASVGGQLVNKVIQDLGQTSQPG